MTTNKPIDAPLPKKSVKVREVDLPDGRKGIEYSDGTIRNEKGQVMIMSPDMAKHAISPANARDMVKRRVELKREAVARAANRVVQDKSLIAEFGDMAYIAEATQTMQAIATEPSAGKAAVMAYESLIKHSGMGEGRDADSAVQPPSLVEQALEGLIRAITSNVVDAEVIPIRNDLLDYDR